MSAVLQVLFVGVVVFLGDFLLMLKFDTFFLLNYPFPLVFSCCCQESKKHQKIFPETYIHDTACLFFYINKTFYEPSTELILFMMTSFSERATNQ